MADDDKATAPIRSGGPKKQIDRASGLQHDVAAFAKLREFAGDRTARVSVAEAWGLLDRASDVKLDRASDARKVLGGSLEDLVKSFGEFSDAVSGGMDAFGEFLKVVNEGIAVYRDRLEDYRPQVEGMDSYSISTSDV